MSQINPKKVVSQGWLIPAAETVVQQVGIDLTVKEDVVLPPKSYKNVDLQERFALPMEVFATLNVRSSFSRKGVFTTSGIYDPGYGWIFSDGSDKPQTAPGGCSLYNISEETITIKKGERILQAVFWDADAASLYDGHYNHTEETASKLG